MDLNKNILTGIKQKLSSLNLSTVSITAITLLIIGLIAYLVIQNPPTQIPSQPSPIPQITASPIPLPQASSPLQNQDQGLIISWQTQPPQLPDKLNLYKIQTPLINNSSSQTIAQNLGFSNQDLVANQPPFLVWSKPPHSLSVNLNSNQLTFNNSSPQLPISEFPNNQIIKQNITERLNQILNSPSQLQVIGEPVILDSSNYQNDQPDKLRSLFFTQSPDNLPIYTTTTNNAPIIVIFDSQLNIKYLEILGGFQTITSISTSSPASYSNLQQTAPQKAQRLPSTNLIKQEKQLNSASQLNLTVQDIRLSFFFDPQNPNLLQPVYSLTGPLSTNDLNFPQSRFIVPALPENLYQ